MKNLLPFLIFSLPLFAAAQSVPNGNFENWSFVGSSENPDFWVTDNTELGTTVSKDFDSHEGEIAMRVTAQPIGVGEYGTSVTLFEISAIPPALNFYAKTAVENGGVSVIITFLNNEMEQYTASWYGTDDMPEYTLISLPLDQIEPVITHARIAVTAEVGDFAPGSAWISVDEMDFGQPMGLNDAAGLHLKLFPNPTKGVLSIESAGDPIGAISIFDTQGKKVHEAYINQQRATLDIHHLPKGVYVVVGDRDAAFTERFVVH